MIGKLRRKFVLFAMISITIVTLFIFGLIAIDMKVRNDTELDNVLTYIAQNGGVIPEYNSESSKSMSIITPETKYSTRYFTVFLDKENNILSTNLEHIFSVDEQKAESMTKTVCEEKSDRGFCSKYRYFIKTNDEGKIIVFLDAHLQLKNYDDFISKAIIIIMVGLIITLIIASLFSKRAAGPIIESIEKQKQFITNAGHDLKTPVAIIMANSEVLEMKLGEDDEWVKSIKNQSKRLDALIKNLLNLAKIGEGQKKKKEKTEFSIDELLQKEIDSMKILAKNKIIEYNRPKDEIKIVKYKPEISQLITILLDNAIKYTPKEGKIEVSIKKYGKNNVQLIISNPYTGDKNISTNKLFDRFYRGDQSRNTKYEGYGIGLSMAKSIVASNKGKISCAIDNNDKINFIVIL